MADGYYDYVYEVFKPQEPTPQTYLEKYKADWEKAVNRLKNSGYDLSKITIVGREHERRRI
ncbi:MAG: hypothetical protein IKE92_05355 [Clostridiales bacterium]|nr:hypothetical protein [Clostridiales bacterium]